MGLNLVCHTKRITLMVCQNKVLRRISVPKEKEVMGGGWRKLHNMELHNFY
jgi:hypothetical protein